MSINPTTATIYLEPVRAIIEFSGGVVLINGLAPVGGGRLIVNEKIILPIHVVTSSGWAR